jgi:hypothetical protein
MTRKEERQREIHSTIARATADYPHPNALARKIIIDLDTEGWRIQRKPTQPGATYCADCFRAATITGHLDCATPGRQQTIT